uniref:Sema domain-containing protein n=1 Tax=Monodelphis domestica TaxID=13616 RepID=A0A5F8H7S1_MONDO
IENLDPLVSPAMGFFSFFLLVLFLAQGSPSPRDTWQCTHIPYASSRNFSVEYVVPSFEADAPIQRVVTYDEGPGGGRAIFVATRNHLHVLNHSLGLLQSLITGPAGHPSCQSCAECKSSDPPLPGEDTDNVVLVLDPEFPSLYSCGSSLLGRCFVHELESDGGTVRLGSTSCLWTPSANSPQDCPDCLASPLGTQVTVVELSHTSYFYVASTLNRKVASRYSPQSVSIRRLKSDWQGFASSPPALAVLPRYLATYPIEYIYTFRSESFVYFLTVQPESLKDSSAFHTRLVRLSAQDTDLGEYRELVLDCRFSYKRRRRRSQVASMEEETYNVLQAAHVAPVGSSLAVDLGILEGQKVLFGAFAVSQEGSRVPRHKSAVCAFPITKLNEFIDSGMERCCESQANQERVERGVEFFQPQSYCPDPPTLGSNVSCWNYPTMIPTNHPRVDLLNGHLDSVLLTAIHVIHQGNATVAHMGTADGRILQVKLFRSLNYLLYVSNFSLGSSQPVHRDVSRLGDHLLFSSGNKVSFPAGGCHQRGWGSGGGVPSTHKHGLCLLQFHPKSGPTEGSTKLTICGSNFHSHFQDMTPKDHWKVTVGQSPCFGRKISPGLMFRLDLPSSKKGYVEQLECLLVASSSQAAGPANVTLTVSATTSKYPFQVNGSSVLSGFSFVVPVVTSIFPLFGPKAGGTQLTIKGQNLKVGSSHRVLVNGTECHLIPTEEEHLLCSTPPGGAEANVSISLYIGGAEIHTLWPFQYRNNPNISSISPNCSYSFDQPISLSIFGPQECNNATLPTERVCLAPAYANLPGRGPVWGDLSIRGDDSILYFQSKFPFYPKPHLHSRLGPLKIEQGSVEVKISGLSAVASCMDVNMTVGGQSCQTNLKNNPVICNVPPTLSIPLGGVPLQVERFLGSWGLSSSPLVSLNFRSCVLALLLFRFWRRKIKRQSESVCLLILPSPLQSGRPNGCRVTSSLPVLLGPNGKMVSPGWAPCLCGPDVGVG